MKLRLDLDGIITSLEIKNYRPSTQENWDEEWCKVTFSFVRNDWLNYGKLDDELLLCSEVEELRDIIKKLLLDEITEPKELGFIEPDFQFEFNPKSIDNQLSLFEEHPQVIDIDAEWKVYFWDDGLTDNYLSVSLIREDLEHLKNYLNYVTGVVDKENPAIQDMINKNILSE